MICVENARNTVLGSLKKANVEERNITSCVGFVLAEDIVSKIDIPSFDNSAMDGYAVQHHDLENKIRHFKILNEIKAGDNSNVVVREGYCAPIYTGAPMPLGADTVVMVEETEIKGDRIIVNDEYESKLGRHIRRRGEQVEVGEIALEKGTTINPSGASYLAALGFTKVKVFSPPKVKIITTGNEIIEAGKELEFGQIYESNSTALITLLKQQGVADLQHVTGRDDVDELLKTFEDLNDFDIVILTGGISMGKYDLVADCLKEVGVEKKFHKIAQKPGKPFYFGILNETLIFALPGNPSAVITSYYEYIFPAIGKMMGRSMPSLVKSFFPLLSKVKIKANRSNFLKGKIEQEGVEVLSGQGSHILNSLAIADCFIYLPKGQEVFHKGEVVEVHLLPK